MLIALVSEHTVKATLPTIGIYFLPLRLSVYRINPTKRAVCYVAKNSLHWKRDEKQSKTRGTKEKKPDCTRGGNFNDIEHRAIIQANMVEMW